MAAPIHDMYTPGEESSMDALLESAASTVDYGPVLDRLRRSWPALVAQHGKAVRGLLDGIPAQLWDNDPWLIGCYAATYRSTVTSSRSAALVYFAAAHAVITDDTQVAIRVALDLHHAAALRSLGRFEEALLLVTAAGELAEVSTEMPLAWRIRLRAKAALQRGLVRYHLGDYDNALNDLRLVDGLAQANLFRSEQIECLGALAMLEYWMGEFGRTLTYIRRALQLSGESGLVQSPFGASVLIADLLVAFDQGRRTDAEALVPHVAHSSWRSDWEPLGLYAQAIAAYVAGNRAEGLDLLRRCLQVYRHWRPPGAIANVSEGLRAMLMAGLGETETAWDILGSLAPTQHHASCPARSIAYLRFLNGDLPGTIAALRACEELGDGHSARTLVEVLVLKAAASHELGNLANSDVAIDRALILAAQSGSRVAFRAVPEGILRDMLTRAAQRRQSPEVHAILSDVQGAAGHRQPTDGPVLSDREREIVRAIVRDASVGDMSDELFISVNTVKSHVKNVYRKLGVSSRSEAIKRARELGLHL